MKWDLRQYDVVLVDLGEDAVGSEQLGIRPAVVIQNNTGNYFSSTTIVLPMTKELKNLSQPTHTLISKGREKGLTKDSMVLGECVRQVSEKRIRQMLGRITSEDERRAIRRVYDANLG